MSVASYEGPASRREVGDQRFLETASLGAAQVEVPTLPETTLSVEQVRALGNIPVQHVEVA